MAAPETELQSPPVSPKQSVTSELVVVEDVKSDSGVLRLSATLASAMCPGAGQWALGRGVMAIVFHLAFAGLAVGCWYGRMPGTYRGLIALLIAAWVLFSLSAWDALRCHLDIAQPRSAIWLAVFIPIAVVVATAFTNAAIRASGFRTYGIPSESMEHTLDIGDRLIVDTTYFKTHVVHGGDIVIFRKGEQQYCKRVIATGGSQVEGINGYIYVGGEQVQEPYAHHAGNAPEDMNNFGPVVVPSGTLFVMGDNRDHSFDSRAEEFGYIPEQNLVGKPLFIYYSERAERNGRELK